MKPVEIELCFTKELAATLLSSHNEIASRVAKMRRKFAREYGFVVPEIKLTDEISAPAKTYQIRIHGTVAATQELRVHDVLVIVGDGRRPIDAGRRGPRARVRHEGAVDSRSVRQGGASAKASGRSIRSR